MGKVFDVTCANTEQQRVIREEKCLRCFDTTPYTRYFYSIYIIFFCDVLMNSLPLGILNNNVKLMSSTIIDINQFITYMY